MSLISRPCYIGCFHTIDTSVNPGVDAIVDATVDAMVVATVVATVVAIVVAIVVATVEYSSVKRMFQEGSKNVLSRIYISL